MPCAMSSGMIAGSPLSFRGEVLRSSPLLRRIAPGAVAIWAQGRFALKVVSHSLRSVSYTHLRAHETSAHH
eukprot:3501099-Alexandrium_andersonii.AAC.1